MHKGCMPTNWPQQNYDKLKIYSTDTHYCCFVSDSKCTIFFHNRCNRVHVDFSGGRGRAATVWYQLCRRSPLLQLLKPFVQVHGSSLHHKLVTICLLKQLPRLYHTFSQKKTKMNRISLFLFTLWVRHTEFRYSKLLHRTRELTNSSLMPYYSLIFSQLV